MTEAGSSRADACARLAGRTGEFKALSDPVRMDLLMRISAVDEISCTDIVREANVSASTVSYHVKILKAAGFVAVRKDGRNYHYTVRSETLKELAGLLNMVVDPRVQSPSAA